MHTWLSASSSDNNWIYIAPGTKAQLSRKMIEVLEGMTNYHLLLYLVGEIEIWDVPAYYTKPWFVSAMPEKYVT